MPTGGVTLDNAGDWIRAGAVAVGAGSRCSTRGDRERAVRGHHRKRAPVRRERRGRESEMSATRRHVRRDYAAARPAGLRAAAAVAHAVRDVRRRRSQRGGQPGAVRPRELLRDAAAVATPLVTPRCARCGPKAFALTNRSRRQPHRHLLHRDRREPARVHGPLRSRAFSDQRDPAGRGRLGRA